MANTAQHNKRTNEMKTMLPDGMGRCLMFVIHNDVNNRDSCHSEMAAGVQEYGKASIWNIICRTV